MTPAERAAATRTFLGLGAEPDKAAAARGTPLFARNCGFCHGSTARGATAPSLITSDVVLGDDHGEHLTPFLQKGIPEKGMPAFARMPDAQLKDVAEFLHLQVEDVANRGAYQVLDILIGNSEKDERMSASVYVVSHDTDLRAYCEQVPLPGPTAAKLDLAGVQREHHGECEDAGGQSQVVSHN